MTADTIGEPQVIAGRGQYECVGTRSAVYLNNVRSIATVRRFSDEVRNAAEDDVIARAAHKCVDIPAPIKEVTSGTTYESVTAGTTDEGVISRPAFENGFSNSQIGKDIVAGSTIHIDRNRDTRMNHE
ncbi:MAG: hypothetical protein DRQ45_08335 [Gammaproteobacteria bacterium]|nr:MAG: hypothetical protein DRQ45_08335 [Gammaproteobacteria bacterium]